MRRAGAFAICLILLCTLSVSALAAFTDVPEGAYYADAVAWALENGVTDGMTAETFCPDEPCTRAQIVAFLWKLAGRPETGSALPFEDVDPAAWYAPAVAWALSEGIANGVSETAFQPDRTCTRAEGAAFLARFCGAEASGRWLPFSDVPDAAWYHDDVLRAYDEGIVSGVSPSRFAPEGSFTRAHMITMLYRISHPRPPQTAVYLGVEGCGTSATAGEKTAFCHRFLAGNGELVCTIPPDQGEYVFQNHLRHGETYQIRVENGALIWLADAASAEADPYVPPVAGEPGVRTVRNFLANALMPVGNALYVYGGGWNWQDTGGGEQTRSVSVPASWRAFFRSQTADYNYKDANPTRSYYPWQGWNAYYYAGLDCSGYVGWAVNRTLHASDGNDYVCSASRQARMLADRGLGTVSGSAALRPGDVVSLSGHVWICLGRCGDGSVVILHSTPSRSRTGVKGGGVQIGAVGPDASCEAYRLAVRYMAQYYPDWSERYVPALRDPGAYLSYVGVFSWSDSVLTDPEGLRAMQADEILRILFGGD